MILRSHSGVSSGVICRFLEDLGEMATFFEDDTLRFVDLAVVACLTLLEGMSNLMVNQDEGRGLVELK